MKIPFIKKSNNSGVWVATLVLSAIAAGAITYYYKYLRAEEEESHNEHALDYLKAKAPKKKKQKTDLHELHSIA